MGIDEGPEEPGEFFVDIFRSPKLLTLACEPGSLFTFGLVFKARLFAAFAGAAVFRDDFPAFSLVSIVVLSAFIIMPSHTLHPARTPQRAFKKRERRLSLSPSHHTKNQALPRSFVRD